MDVNYIPLEDCKHGYLYKIHSRNLSYGVFKSDVNGFVGIRTKFGDRYLFTEYHWDTGAPFGTVHPTEEICECPVQNLNDWRRDNEQYDELFEFLDSYVALSNND